MKERAAAKCLAILSLGVVLHTCSGGDGNGGGSPSTGGGAAGMAGASGGAVGSSAPLTECQKIIVEGCLRIYACLDAPMRKDIGYEGTQNECVQRGFARCETNSACPEGTAYDHTKSAACLDSIKTGLCSELVEVDFVPDTCWARCACKGVAEICNGIDDDCDGLTDEDLPQVAIYEDADGDGYGGPGGQMRMGCGAVEGWGVGNQDCDDGNPEVHPKATEICNKVDDDCDGFTDENAIPRCGIGLCRQFGHSCDRPETCIPTIAGKERCDLRDNDCDGQTDEDPDTLCIFRDGETCVDGKCVPIYKMAAVPGGGKPFPYQHRHAKIGSSKRVTDIKSTLPTPLSPTQ